MLILNSIGNRWKHDDIPKEKIINIYETEKAKLLELESTLERTICKPPENDKSSQNSPSPTKKVLASHLQCVFEIFIRFATCHQQGVLKMNHECFPCTQMENAFIWHK